MVWNSLRQSSPFSLIVNKATFFEARVCTSPLLVEWTTPKLVAPHQCNEEELYSDQEETLKKVAEQLKNFAPSSVAVELDEDSDTNVLSADDPDKCEIKQLEGLFLYANNILFHFHVEKWLLL